MRSDIFRTTRLDADFLAYNGRALRPFVERRVATLELLADCAVAAIERGDTEGARLARLLLRMTVHQRQRIRQILRAVGDPGPGA